MLSRLAMVSLAVAVGVSSCATERPIVDQVQTNIISKSVFSGEWYYTRTVVDLDESGGQLGSFIGDMAFDYAYLNDDYPELPPVARIRWVITENTLFAFRSHEIIDGGNADANDPGFLGEPLAAFTIDSHLDVIQKFNSSTGENINVEAEDTSSRRWYEREYIRVDWSQADLSAYYDAGGWGPREMSQYYDENADNVGYRPLNKAMSCGPDDAEEDCDADDLRFHGDYDKGEVYYLSFVSQEVWTPTIIGCNYYNVCSSGRADVRTSFRKVSPRHEYTTLQYQNNRWENFGIFRVPQKTYSRGGLDDPHEGYSNSYGLTDFQNLYANRHNIWKQHFQHDAGGEILRDAMGEPVPLSHDALWDAANVRTVDYWLVKNTPTYTIRPSMQVFLEWNDAFARMWRTEAGTAQPEEGGAPIDCRVTPDPNELVANPGDPTSYEGDTAMQFEGTECIFRLHVNPCDVDEENACVELGDTRFHFFNVIRTVSVGFSGVSVPQADPVTGELLTSNVNFAEQTLANISTRILDQIRAMEGINDDFGIINGEDTRQYLANNLGRVVQPVAAAPTGTYAKFGGGAGVPGGDGGSGGSGDRVEWSGTPAVDGSTLGVTGEAASLHDMILQRVEQALPQVERLRGIDGQQAVYSGRWNQIREADPTIETDFMAGMLGSDWASQPIMNSEILGLGAIPAPSPGLDTTATGMEEEVLDAVSPFRVGAPGLFEPPALQRERDMMARGFEFFDVTSWSDESIGALRQNYGDCPGWQYGDACVDSFAMRVQQDTLRFIMLHELGHSVGLRHNFAGSTDYVNYPDSWYQTDARYPLPKADPMAQCPQDCVDCDGDGAFDSRNFDCDGNSNIDAAEQELWRQTFRRQREARKAEGADLTQLSSVMDYPGQSYQWQGHLGRYDHAAIRHSYANEIEAFVGDPRIDQDDYDMKPIQYRDGPDGEPTVFPRQIWHYYVGGEHCTRDTDCPSSALDQAVTQTCKPNPRYVHQNEADRQCDPTTDQDCVCSNFEEDFRNATFNGVDCDGDGEVRGENDRNFDCDGSGETDFVPVPYAFCTDDRLQDISWCSVYDTGPSFRDIVMNAADDYDRSYIWGNFRRYRDGFRGNGAVQRIFPIFAKIYQHFFYRYYYEPGFSSRTSGFGFVDQYMSSIDTMNFFASVISRPDVGSYEIDPTRATPERSVLRQVSDTPDGTGAVDIDLGVGKWLWSTYQDHHQGYFMLERQGTHLDKLLAIDALTRRDWALNYNYDERFLINYYDLFPSEMLQVFGGLIANDPDRFGARLTTNAAGEDAIEFMDYSRGTRGFQYCLEPAEDLYDAVGPTFDDSISMSVRNFALYSALFEFPVYFNPTFQMQLQICVEGTADCVTIPETDPGSGRTLVEGVDYIRYRSDQFHKTYVAYDTDGTPEFECDRPAPSFELLQQMKADQDTLASLEASGGDEETIRMLRQRIQGNESFLETMIYLQDRLRIIF